MLISFYAKYENIPQFMEEIFVVFFFGSGEKYFSDQNVRERKRDRRRAHRVLGHFDGITYYYLGSSIEPSINHSIRRSDDSLMSTQKTITSHKSLHLTANRINKRLCVCAGILARERKRCASEMMRRRLNVRWFFVYSSSTDDGIS